jgi:hypothetical protein
MKGPRPSDTGGCKKVARFAMLLVDDDDDDDDDDFIL